MSKLFWFGTRERMVWVRCPAFNANISPTKWGVSGTYLNGGGYVRTSGTFHKVYQFAWNLAKSEDIHAILDYASGIYGDGLIYFLDPFAVTTNVLPMYWSAPRLAKDDAPSLVKDQRPTLSDTEANQLGYPTKSAVYTLSNASVPTELYIPVPPDHTFHIGVHGSATGSAGMSVIPVNLDGTSGPATAIPTISANSEQRTTTTVTNVSGVLLQLSGTGVISLSGIIAQVRPNGQEVPTGGFISGQGHSGVRFDGDTPINGYSAPDAQDLQGATATLRETGSWE